MPIHPVSGGGYQWGSQKIYRGKNAKAKAQRQANAIYASGYRENGSSRPTKTTKRGGS